jgi:hypothetical protein
VAHQAVRQVTHQVASNKVQPRQAISTKAHRRQMASTKVQYSKVATNQDKEATTQSKEAMVREGNYKATQGEPTVRDKEVTLQDKKVTARGEGNCKATAPGTRRNRIRRATARGANARRRERDGNRDQFKSDMDPTSTAAGMRLSVNSRKNHNIT